MMKMEIGMRGESVRALKERLAALRYDVTPTDEYDRATDWAVRWFCARNGSEDAADRLIAADAVPGVDGGLQAYSMADPLWADYPYDAVHTVEIERMHNSSCGPTSMAMAVSTLVGRAVLPPVLADWSNAHGFRDPNGIDGTDERFFPACAELYGLRGELLYVDEDSANAGEVYDRLAEALEAGKIVIATAVAGSPFTKGGHYLLLTSMAEDRMTICDPNPGNWNLPVYTRKEWMENRWSKLFAVISK